MTNRPAGHPRRELAIAAIYLALLVVVPLLVDEAYPLSSVKLFVDTPRVYCRYQVTGPDGQALPLAWFSLDRAYFGLDGYYHGHPEPHRGARRAPPTIDVFGEIPDEARVAAAVQAGLARFEHLPMVVVTQEVIGAKDDQHIGVVERRVFEVQKPGAAP